MKKTFATLGSLFALCAAFIISPAVAQVPQFPQTLQPNTVVGRLGIGPGPAQAIPFGSVYAGFFTAGTSCPTNLGVGQPFTNTSAGPTGTIINFWDGTQCVPWATLNQTAHTFALTDTTEVIGSGAKKWTPLFFGNAGTATVHRFNRVFVGEATASSSDTGPVTTKDWSETLLGNTVGVTELAAVDTTGQLAVYGASRSSDFRTVFSSATGGAQGVTGLGYNNDTTGAPIAVGISGIGVRASGVGGITTGYQADMNNAGSVVDIEPSVAFAGGTTAAALATSGAFSAIGTTNVPGAYVINQGRTSGPVFRKGLVVMQASLDTTVGGGGGGLAGEFFRGMSLRWRNATPTTDSEIWGNASGLTINSAAVVAAGITSGTAGGTGGSLTLNGATSGSRAIAVNATAGAFTFAGAALDVGSGGTGDTGTAWTTFSPNATCGTATFTTNTGKSKTLGKTTWINLDIKINALGTCTASMTLTLPNTGNSPALISGQDISGTSREFLGCQVAAASNSSTCTKRGGGAFIAAEEFINSGVYENQ